jgi:hypothetical protein
MTDSTLVDLVKVFINTQGTGTLALGSALPSFRGVEALVDGLIYDYSIQQGANFEYGTGTFTAGDGTLTRGVQASSYGGAPIPLVANAVCTFTALASSLLRPGPQGNIGPRGIGVPTPVTIITGDYTLLATDVETYLLFQNTGGPAVLTVPSIFDVALPLDSVIFFEQNSANDVTLAPADGVTLNSRGGFLKTGGQFAVGQIKQVQEDIWTVIGDMTT